MSDSFALCYVEIDIDYCSLVYGTAPCTAAIPTTGDIKCFNTISTCQDRANFTNAPVTLRFSEDASYYPRETIEAIASITDVNYSPARISLGEDLGQRASLTVSFQDHRHSDTGQGFDKYLADRTYNPFEQGSFWGKFRTRQRFLRGRSMRLIMGFLGDDLADMETRHFLIESFEGPGLDGTFTITAKDALKLADGDRAQAPALSEGRLSAGITSSATSATLAPTGIGSTYPASGYLNIGGKEIVSFTRSSDSLTITRAQFNTVGVAHSAGDRLQLCLYYNAEDPADISADLQQTYAGMPSSYITLVNWQTETATYYGRVLTALIPEPTPVKTLQSEIIQQVGLCMWPDDVGEKIELRVLRAIATDAESFDDSNVIEGSLKAYEQPEKRISQVWTYFGMRNPLEGLNPDNFRSTAITVDLNAEEDYGQPAIKKIFSRWIPFGGLTAAERVNDIQLARYVTAPRRFTYSVMRGASGGTPTLGEGCRLQGLPMQNQTGAYEDVPIQIVRIRPGKAVIEVEAEEMLSSSVYDEDPTFHPITIDADVNNFNLRTTHDTLYPAPVKGDRVECTVNLGVTVGSTSTSTPAFDVGTFPTEARTGLRTSGSPILTGLSSTTGYVAGMGVTGTGIPAGAKILTVDSGTQITLDANATSGSGTSTSLTIHVVRITLRLLGRIQGKGGVGAAGWYAASANGVEGSVGGPALYTRAAINLDLGSGDADLFGGGGGGASGGLQYNLSGSGGGGAGTLGGSGGPAGHPSAPAGGNGSRDAGGSGTAGGDFAGAGGNGGGPGLNGGSSSGYGAYSGASGGAAGAAIDGISLVKKTGTGDVRGGEIN